MKQTIGQLRRARGLPPVFKIPVRGGQKTEVPKPVPVNPAPKRERGTRKGEEPARGLPTEYRPSVSLAPDSMSEAVEYVYEDIGLAPIDNPQFDPKLPEDITKVDDHELGRLLGQFSAMIQYLEERVALADISSTDKDTVLDALKAEVRLLATGTVPDKTAIVLTHPTVIEALLQSLQASAVVKLLKSRMSGYERAYGAISREISRRDTSMAQSSRVGGLR